MSEGYEFVPLPPEITRRPRPEAAWDQRRKGTFSGSLRVTFCAEQPVHIGSGQKRLHEGKVIRVGVRILGRPGIPGSSLKGVLLSRYEAITKSCVQAPPARGHKVRSQTHEDIKRAELTGQALGEPAFQGKCNDRTRCPACALFGLMSLRSRVTVRDLVCMTGVAFQVVPIDPQFDPNLHHVGEYTIVPASRGDNGRQFQVHRLRGRKFAAGMGPAGDGKRGAPRGDERRPSPRAGEYVPPQPPKQWIEVIPTGSTITGELGLYNVMPAELGGLLTVLGCAPASALKIGGGKGRGFGRLRLTALHYALRDHTGCPVDMNEEQWRRSFVDSSDYWKDGEPRLIKIHQGDC